MRARARKRVVTGRTQAKLDEVAAGIAAAGGNALALQALAGVKEDAVRTVAEAASRWGRVDVLVNNAHTFTDYLPLDDPKMEEHCLIDLLSAHGGSTML